MKLVIPGIPPKYNKAAIILIVVLLIFVLFPTLLKNLIGGTIKGIGGGIKDGINDILQTPVPQDTKDAMTWLDQWGHQHSDGAFMSSQLFDNNPGDASIDANTALNLWNNVDDCVGWFSNDMSGLQGQFQAVVGNQTDISRVAAICMQKTGRMMGDYMYAHFYGPQPMILKNFIVWASSLPTN